MAVALSENPLASPLLLGGPLSFASIHKCANSRDAMGDSNHSTTSRQFTGKSGKTWGDFWRPGRLVDHSGEKGKPVAPAACDGRGRTQEVCISHAEPIIRHTSDTYLEQRAIVHQLLRDDHTERWTPKQLQQASPTSHPRSIDRRRRQAGGEPAWSGAWTTTSAPHAAPATSFALDLIGI